MGTWPRFEFAREAVIEILGERPKVRLWVPRCGAGAEAYEWAAILRRHIAGLVIFATDDNVHAACTGLFSDDEVMPLMDTPRHAVVERAPGGWEISPRLRHHVIRADHVLLQDAPLGRMDLISLGNARITTDEWPAVLRMMQRCLRTGGLLFIGADTMPTPHDGFTSVAPGLLQRLGPTSAPARGVEPPVLPTDADLLDLLAPPTLLMDAHQNVNRRLGAVRPYLLAPDNPWPRPLAEAVPATIAGPARTLMATVIEGKELATAIAGGVRLTVRRVADELFALTLNAHDQTAILTGQNARLAAANADLRARLNTALRDGSQTAD